MKVGVTGAAGFIGGYVIESLIRRGHEPIGFDHKRRADWLGDVCNPTDMLELAAHVDGIIHLAACLGTQETVQNPRPAVETNIGGGINFLEACAHYSIPGVFIGVGNHWMNNPYSITKSTVERFVSMYNKERGTRVNVVRVVNAYGPRQSVAPPYGSAKVRKITPSFICRALRDHPIEIYGDGLQISDMVYVADVADALVVALEHAAAGDVTDVVEVGPVEHTTVREVAELIIDLCGSRSELKFLPMRPGEIPGASVTANTATLTAIGLRADKFVPLVEGMKRTIEHYSTI